MPVTLTVRIYNITSKEGKHLSSAWRARERAELTQNLTFLCNRGILIQLLNVLSTPNRNLVTAFFEEIPLPTRKILTMGDKVQPSNSSINNNTQLLLLICPLEMWKTFLRWETLLILSEIGNLHVIRKGWDHLLLCKLSRFQHQQIRDLQRRYLLCNVEKKKRNLINNTAWTVEALGQQNYFYSNRDQAWYRGRHLQRGKDLKIISANYRKSNL